MSWLPRKLSPQVRCVFSLIRDSIQHTTLVKRETKPIEINLPPLDLESRKVTIFILLWEIIQVAALQILEKCLFTL